ncbi:hypothetical protein [Antrihabitans sp. YC2-6]|uniref:hypothetical protein n=1 Tax=Antrihabitans sp. YC2-6 TaxID=2799498 RepID=UPI001F27DBBB|nr:hypothetical protein [Antrihabitans sp. YC2-6]
MGTVGVAAVGTEVAAGAPAVVAGVAGDAAVQGPGDPAVSARVVRAVAREPEAAAERVQSGGPVDPARAPRART